MADRPSYKVPLSELLAVKVPKEQQVESQDPTPESPPDLVPEDERHRLEVLRNPG